MPEGNRINIKCDYRECEGVTYVNLSEPEYEVMLVQTARKFSKDI